MHLNHSNKFVVFSLQIRLSSHTTACTPPPPPTVSFPPPVFEAAGVDSDRPMVASCGSGITACIVAMAAHVAFNKDIPVYDVSYIIQCMLVLTCTCSPHPQTLSHSLHPLHYPHTLTPSQGSWTEWVQRGPDAMTHKGVVAEEETEV